MSPAVNDICAALPVVLPLMIQDVMAAGAASPKDVMHLLEDSLRNTVFVSHVDYNLTGHCELGQEGSFAEQVARRELEAVLGVSLIPVGQRPQPTKTTARRGVEGETHSKWWATGGEPRASAREA